MIRFITDIGAAGTIIQKIADDIKALTIHPVATEEYSAGYQAARHDAWLIAQDAAEDASPTTPTK